MPCDSEKDNIELKREIKGVLLPVEDIMNHFANVTWYNRARYFRNNRVSTKTARTIKQYLN